MNKRGVLLAVLATLLLSWGLWQVYAGWGLVSLDFDNAPVGKVLAAIGRQGGIEIVSNLDPSTRVTIKAKRIPPLEALDVVAVRTDSSWRLAYLGAQNKAAIDTALASFRSGQASKEWSGKGGGGFTAVETKSGVPLDLRLAEWQPTAGGDLQNLMKQAADETGVYFSAPSDWSPQVEEPEGGRITDAAPALFRKAGGVVREVFLLRGPSPGEAGSDEGGGWRGGGGSWIGAAAPRGSGNGERRGPGGPGSPESMAKRTEAQIKLLPLEEQKTAREEIKQMREFWQSVRDLPEEQRRAKAREFFDRPEVQQRMEDSRLARDAKMTPQQRIQRSQRYWDRKAATKYGGAR